MSGFGKKKKGRKQTTAKKTSVDGIEFQSGLEAYTYKALKRAGIPNDYEKVSFELVPAFKSNIAVFKKRGAHFKDNTTQVQSITYKPDFTAKDLSWIIEVKGRKFKDFMMRWKLFLRYLKGRDLTPEVFMVSTEVEVDLMIDYLKEKDA
jgi:hypothetical protein